MFENRTMKKIMRLSLGSVAGVGFLLCGVMSARCAEPIRALLITGGGSHDYKHQKDILTEGISARANIAWTISYDGVDDRTHEATIYSKPDWWKGYDVIVHDECYGM